jgi:hypothetical protein
MALLGIVVAAGISVAASRLSSQRIGLSSEPISAGRELAPPSAASSPAGHPGRHRQIGRGRGPGAGPATATPPSTTAPSPPATTAPAPAAPQPAPATGNGDDSGESHSGGDD